MKPFFAALSFLTIIPVPASWCGDEESLAHSLTWFPLVGLTIGIALAVVDTLLRLLFPGTMVASAIVVIAMIAISGGLHLDGVADSADAFMSSRPRTQMLEIMKDSRIGAMGALTIAALLLLKFSALTSIPAPWRAPALVLMPLAGRTALVIQTNLLPYARPNGGLATLMQRNSRPWQGVVAVLFITTVASVLLGWCGLWIALAAVTTTLLFSRYCKAKIGGLTGDTLGAVCELVEIVPALALLMCMQQGLLP